MLLKRRADVTCRDDRGVSALEYAIREDRQEVVLAILEHAGHVVNAVGPRGTTALLVACECRREAIARALLDCGAKVDALKNRLNIESATMLAKIGTEKGIMLFGIKRDQKEADFANRGLGPADAILISSDLVTGGLTSIDLSGNQLCGVWTQYGQQHGTYTAEGIAAIAEALRVNGSLTVANLLGNQLDAESAKMLTKVAKQKGISLCGIQRDQTTADFRHKDLKPPDAILLASDLSQAIVTGALTSLNLSKNQLCGVDSNGWGTYTTGGITAIADALRVNGVLTSVELRGNKLGDEGWGAIFAAICGNKDSKIMSMDVSYENIGFAGGKLIAEALRTSVTSALTKME